MKILQIHQRVSWWMDGALHDVAVNDTIIKAKLAKLRSDKAAGADAMSPWLLKEIHEYLVTPVSVYSSLDFFR